MKDLNNQPAKKEETKEEKIERLIKEKKLKVKLNDKGMLVKRTSWETK